MPSKVSTAACIVALWMSVFGHHVAVVEFHLAVEAALQLAAVIVLDIGRQHARAFGDEQLDRAAPDPRSRAGDDGDLVSSRRSMNVLPMRAG